MQIRLTKAGQVILNPKMVRNIGFYECYFENMVIVIHQTASTQNALLYNEEKVQTGVATCFHSANTLMTNPFLFDQTHRMKILHNIESLNSRVKNKCLHISVNPSVSDSLILDDRTMKFEIGKMMEHMGYGDQPYFVYKHKDMDRILYHVVSTRIDSVTGKKIKDSYEQQRMQRFIQTLEQKYGLKQEENQSLNKQNDFTINATCSDLKARVEGIIRLLNQSAGIENETMYGDILKSFGLEVKQSGKGAVILISDIDGKTIRNPLRKSDLEEIIKTVDSTLKPDKVQLKQVEERMNVGFKSSLKNAGFVICRQRLSR